MNATLPHPDHPWSLEEQVVAVQQVAYQLFAAQNWVWAAKLLYRAERLARRLDPERNPFEQAGRALMAAARRTPAPPPPKPAPEPPPPDFTDEEHYATFIDEYNKANALRARAGVPRLTFELALSTMADVLGQARIDSIAAIHARPSG